MQQSSYKNLQFKKALGKVLSAVRTANSEETLNKFAYAYDIDRGHLSKIERGLVGCSVMTAWRISEACGIKLSKVIKMFEEELGENFRLMDE